jgi:hypothetical protein
VSIALFFLLSGLFLSVLLGAIERSRKLLAVAGACLVAVVCIIVFLTPVQLPNLGWWNDEDGGKAEAPAVSTTTPPSTAAGTTTTLGHFTVTTLDMTVTTLGPGDGRY